MVLTWDRKLCFLVGALIILKTPDVEFGKTEDRSDDPVCCSGEQSMQDLLVAVGTAEKDVSPSEVVSSELDR